MGNQPHHVHAGDLRAGHTAQRVMSDRCVIICSSVCDGDYSEKLWPYTREMMQLYQNKKHPARSWNEYGETFARNQQYIDQYRFQ
jgi:hypothetical protein